MSKGGPILLVDDDPDDQHLIQSVCNAEHIENPLVIFNNGMELIDYLRTTSAKPFLILCDMNMPLMNGLQIRDVLNKEEYLRKKSIPFVFFSTTATQQSVDTAYDMTVQGYFEKGSSYQQLKERLKLIFDYWRECQHPNSF